MPTLDDLNAVFDDLESRAPETVTLARVHATHPRRGRTALMLLSAAAVVALTVGAAVMAPHLGARPVAAASGQTVDLPVGASPTSAALVSMGHGQTGHSTATAPAASEAVSSKPAPSVASSSAGQTAPNTVRVPFRITGVGDLTLRQAAFDGTNGGVVVETAGTAWAFGWSMESLSASEKPATGTVNFDGRDWVVQRDRTTSAIISLWVTAPGFGMTITPVGTQLTLDQYASFLAHVSFPPHLDSPSTWPTAADLK